MGSKNTYEIILYSQAGLEIQTISNAYSFRVSRGVNDIGELELTLTGWDLYSLFKPDCKISVSRSVDNGPMALVGDTLFFVTGISKTRESRQKFLVIKAVDTIGILARRVVPYPSGTAYTTKTAAADNLAKAVVRENFGSLATGTGRNASSVFAVQADTSQAPTISRAFAYKNCLTALQDIAQTSFQSGTALFFDVFAYSPTSFEFRTYTNQRGVDLRNTVAVLPLTVDINLNVGDFEFSKDYSGMKSFIYVGGQGTAAARTTITAFDPTRVYSDLGLIEKFVDGRSNGSSTYLIGEAQSALRDSKAKIVFVGELLQSQNLRFGVELNYGDYFTLQMEQENFDVLLNAFSLEVDHTGKETLKAVLRSEL